MIVPKDCERLEKAKQKVAHRLPYWEPVLKGSSPAQIANAVTWAIESLRPDSGAGYPAGLWGANTEQVLRENYHAFHEECCELLRIQLCKTEKDPFERLVLGQQFPVAPFEKDEPNPERKASIGAYRMVFATGMHNQVLDRVMWGGIIDEVKQIFPYCVATIGIGFDESHAEVFGEEIQRLDKKFGVSSFYSDVSGWDRSQSHDWLKEALQIVLSKMRGTEEQKRLYTNIAYNWLVNMTNAVFVGPDGSLLMSIVAGLMPSGAYPTTLFNAIARALAAFYAGAVEAKCVGDDTIEWHLDGCLQDLQQKYAEINLVLRDIKTNKERDFEFCSHRFFYDGSWKTALTSWPKTLLRFLTQNKPNADLLLALENETKYNNEEEKEKIYQCVRIRFSADIGRAIGGIDPFSGHAPAFEIYGRNCLDSTHRHDGTSAPSAQRDRSLC